MRVTARSLTPLVVAASLAVSAALTQAQDKRAALPGSGASTAPAPDAAAIVLVDPRLYALIQADLDAYVSAAAARRGFTISTVALPGLDDMAPADVKAQVVQWRAADPALEGVLFVGNVKLPTFFAPRADTLSTRFFTRFYEDLDMVVTRQLAPGSVIQDVNGNPFTVPPHDFDAIEQGPSFGSELWAAFLPVGFTDATRDSYASWAEQLRAPLRKALAAYQDPAMYTRDAYILCRDPGYMAEAGPIWSGVGPEHISFYAVNDHPNAGYDLAPLTSFTSLQAFMDYDRTLPDMPEGWQDPATFLAHMAQENPAVVTWCVHSDPEWSLVSSDQAQTMAGGGKVAFLGGCSVGGYKQPGTTYVDTLTAVDRDILVCLVYGPSRFVAGTGSIHNRVEAPCLEPAYASLYGGSYLGSAHRLQLDEIDREYFTDADLKGHHEILIGDPFMDIVGGSTTQQLPDLVVDSVTTTPACPVAGEPVTFHATIRNLGPGVVVPQVPFGIAFEIDGRTVARSVITTALVPGGTLRVDSPAGGWVATDGAHALGARVNDRGELIETTLTNNELVAAAPLVGRAFTDVLPGDYCFDAVEALHRQGVLGGYADGTFRPGHAMTRGQLCKVLVLATGATLVTPSVARFSDVPVGSTFFSYVETAAALGWVSGHADGTFGPGSNVSRGQLCKMVVRAKGYALVSPSVAHFADVAVGSTFFDYVETAYAHGLISGYADGTFRPAARVTRGQVAKVVCGAATSP